jgi:hypothetical protein
MAFTPAFALGGGAGMPRFIEGSGAPSNSLGSPGVSLGANDSGLPSANAPAAGSAFSLSGLPANLRSAPWIESLTHQGPELAPLVSLPNLALLKNPPATVGGRVNPLYVAQPAPLGLGDFGLGAKTYSYTTSHFLGQLTFYSPPNDTDPGSTGVIEPGGSHDGFVGSVHEFGIQLNTVAMDVAIPGTDAGFFWTQNVIDWNGTGIHFVDDTFNLTSPSRSDLVIAPGTIYSGCGNSSSGVDVILKNYGGVFQCVGGTIPIRASDYPITLEAYNNATVNSQNRPEISYGYRIVETGAHKVYTGVSDSIVFNSPGAPRKAPAHSPEFTVDGSAPTPPGLFRDAEFVLVGDIGGDNSVFRAMNATMNLEYSNATKGGFRDVPSAYNFGGDTGETSTGLADYWTTSHSLEIHQGPAMLYGLWNAIPYVSVRSGSIHLAGSIAPSYGFVFVSNTRPVLNPWTTRERDNMSWMPTTDSGTFNTYLPPLGGRWTTEYYVQGFAAGAAEVNGTAVKGTDTSYRLSLPSARGPLRAPLYAFSNAQAAALAKAVTGSSASPFVFSHLTVNINFTFDHLNDYGFPTFVLFMMQGVTDSIHVDHVYQGQDSSKGNYYITDFSDPPEFGLLGPAPETVAISLGTSGIDIFDGAHDVISDQMTAAEGSGLQVILWQDSKAQVSAITSELDSAGVWVGDSIDTTLSNIHSETGATGVTDVGSSHTSGSDLSATGALAVEALSSSDATFTSVTASNAATGVEAGYDYGASADYDTYYYLPGTTGLTLRDISATDGSLAANLSFSAQSTVTTVTVTLSSDGIYLDNSPHATITGVTSSNYSTGVYVYHSTNVEVESVTAYFETTGVKLDLASDITVDHDHANDLSIGVYVEASKDLHFSDVTATDDSIAIYYA